MHGSASGEWVPGQITPQRWCGQRSFSALPSLTHWPLTTWKFSGFFAHLSRGAAVAMPADDPTTDRVSTTVAAMRLTLLMVVSLTVMNDGPGPGVDALLAAPASCAEGHERARDGTEVAIQPMRLGPSARARDSESGIASCAVV